MKNWKQANLGGKWVPEINKVEELLGIPKDLLARMAFQESSFSLPVIEGSKPSPAGALGILQMLPKYFSSVREPVPFSDVVVERQIHQAGDYLVSLFNRFGSWAEALAAYNYGPDNEEKFLEHKLVALPRETMNYVSKILADVPPPVRHVDV